ncbi:MAG: hypothetical protein OEM79_04090 [Nitrosopumilus sp.]|nr:hypothetical protein [Nitrosopumilus sp.]
MKHSTRKYIIVILVTSIFSFLVFSNEASAHYGEQLSGYGTAEIDGNRSVGEWDDAYVISVFGGKSDGSRLLVMNDENNLYVGLIVIDNLLTPDDQLGIMFDNSHNGVIDNNDDSGGFSGLGIVNDGHFNGTNWIVDSSIQGVGEAQNDGIRNFLEYSKPLNSGDENDFNLSIGDTVGFCLTYIRDGIATDSTQYGPACRLLTDEQNLYGDILLVPFSLSWHGQMAMDADKRNVEYGEVINYEGYLYGDELIDEEPVYITISELETDYIKLEKSLVPNPETVDYFENTAWPFTFKIDTAQNDFKDDMTYVVEAKYNDQSTKLNFLIKANTKSNLEEKAVDAGEAIAEAGTETSELVVEAGKEAGKVIVDAGEEAVEKGKEIGQSAIEKGKEVEKIVDEKRIEAKETVEQKGSEVIQEIEETAGGGCLIATATFNSELSPQVQQLRELRDNKLLQTETGTLFMDGFNDFYYSFSPQIADYERKNPIFKEAVKIVITPGISSLTILNYVDLNSESNVLGYGISLIILNIGMYFGVPAIVVWQVGRRF